MVDVANHTLEQLVYTDESETRRSYAAVLTADKNRDFLYIRRKKRRDSDHKDCPTRQKEFGRSRISPGARDDRLPPGRRRRGTWETKGFGRRDVGARMPYIELLCFSCFVIMFVLRVWLSSYKCDVVCMLFVCCFVTRCYSSVTRVLLAIIS